MFKFLEKNNCFNDGLNQKFRKNYEWVRKRNNEFYKFYVFQYGDKKKIVFSKRRSRDIFEYVKHPIYQSEPDLSKL